jgi:SAM-dependent methyltransferase
MKNTYVHGYDPRENERLSNQASTLTELLQGDTHYAAGSRVLEAGCGVGSQTLTLASRSPQAQFTCIDISGASIALARERVTQAGHRNVDFQQADIFALRFEPASFDHIFVCFVLEHLPQPVEALKILRKLLRPGGTLTVIEGDHGLTAFHPDNAAARDAIQCQVELQSRAGGNALIGRQLQPPMTAAGLTDVRVSPRMVYVDGSRPQWAEGFTRNTFTAMIQGVREPALAAGLIDAQRFDEGLLALLRTAESDGVFCYSFFKAVGVA